MIKQVDKKLGTKSWNLLERFCLIHYGIAMFKRKLYDLIPTPLKCIKDTYNHGWMLFIPYFHNLVLHESLCICVGKGSFFPLLLCRISCNKINQNMRKSKHNKVNNNNINQNIKITYIDCEVVTYTTIRFTSISKNMKLYSNKLVVPIMSCYYLEGKSFPWFNTKGIIFWDFLLCWWVKFG
jgi:hypothetical protein